MTPAEHIRRWLPELSAWRRDFHAHPELAFQEHRTAALVAERLEGWGLEVHRGVGRTGVVGVLRSGGGNRAVGLRADMDALPIEEVDDGRLHRSTVPGVMHACGHDGHTTMLLAAARHLAETRDFEGTVHFIFQPAEEGGLGGAKGMIADGLFERFPCDAVYAAHNYPGIPVGHFGLRPGAMMAGSAFFDLHVRGRGGHGAMPEVSVDPIVCAAQIVCALQTVVARNVAPSDTAVLSVTGLSSGGSYNAIPENASLRGTVRAFRPEVMRLLEERLRALAAAVAAGFGATAELEFRQSSVPLINGAMEAAMAADAAASLVGVERVDRDYPVLVASEDFSFMLAARPGAFVLVGNGTGDAGGRAVHTPGYDFNDEAIPFGAGLLAEVAKRELARPAPE